VTEKLQIIPVKKGSEPIVWHMSHGSVSGGPGNYPRVRVAHQTVADFEISIVNPGSIRFSSDPIWIHEGTEKPTEHVIEGISEISGQNATTLKFHDGNKDAGTLTYVLNFVDAPQLDPIIDNQGGGPG
jgi:hypothetical protein